MSDPSSLPARRGLQLFLLAVAITTAAYAKVALSPLQETMRIALAMSDNQMALLQGPALAISMVLLAIPLGLVIDRCSRVRLLFVLLVLILIGSLLTATARHFTVLFAARALVGLGAFSIESVVLSLIADLYAQDQRGRASMIILAGQFTGVGAVFALGGALLALSGSGPDAWRWALIWLTGPLLALVLILMLALQEPARTERGIDNPSARQSLAEFWRYRAVITMLMTGGVFVIVAIQSVMIWTAPTLSRVFALPPDRVGAIMAIAVPVGGVVGTIVSSILADFCQRTGGPLRTISVMSATAFFAMPLSFFSLMPSATSASVLLVTLVAILIAVAHMATTLAIVVIPNELRGLYFGISGGVGAIFGVGLAPLLVSSLSGVIGGQGMIGTSLALVCISASLLGAVIFAFGRRYLPRASIL